MIFTLKDYQRKAVDELKAYFEFYFKFTDRKGIVFKAPTGSGKTFMVSSLFQELVEEREEVNFCVLWACPGTGDLHKQSFESVKRYVNGYPTCSLLEEDFYGYRREIKKHEIVFVNWEKLVSKDAQTGLWKNNLMRDQEGANFLDVLEQTRRNETKIILVVDESHIGRNAHTRIQEFINTIIEPNIVLEMSATPLTEPNVEVDPLDVIAEGMIKADIIVNEGISTEDRSLEERDSELIVLEKAYEKQEELKQAYQEIGSKVNPLVLIQIPNVDAGEAKKIVVKDFLRDKDITEENGKLKIWTQGSGGFDKKKIRELKDITEYLIFKIAVATGWDCPRAQTLVKFREGKSEIFEIQTIGRILRTAEAKAYEDELLDNAYIFTNIQEFEMRAQTYNPNRIKTEFSYFKKPYTKQLIWEQTQLQSYYRSREGDYNSANSQYTEYFLKAFMEYFELTDEEKNSYSDAIAPKLESKGMILSIDVADTLMEETLIGTENIGEEQTIIGGQVDVRMSESDIYFQYYDLIKQNLNDLAYVRSKSSINSAIVNTFKVFYNRFSREELTSSVQKIVVNNKDIFSEILDKSTREFREELMKNAGKKGKNDDFYIEDKKAYSIETHKQISAPKSLYEPLFMLKDENGNINMLEARFLNYLDNQEKVEWYWVNGPEHMKTNFGISYNNGMNTFQPDFIVRFTDGTVGIFDTKPIDIRVEDTGKKQKALFEYIEIINEKRESNFKVIGGMVIEFGTHFFVYMKEDYHTFNDSREGWINFNQLIREL